MKSNYKKIIGYTLLLASLLITLIFSFNPELIIFEGNSLDTGYMISKTIFISISMLILSIIGVKLISEK